MQMMGKGEKDSNQFEPSWNFTVEIQLQHNLAFGVGFVLILFVCWFGLVFL